MLWKYIIEGVLVLATMSFGYGFWSVLKSPTHLTRVLQDSTELKRFIDFIGPDKLVSKTQSLEPILDSFAKNIETWEKAHIISLRSGRNLSLLLSIGIFIGSYFMGWSYLTINFILFLSLSVVPIATSAKNNNMSHIHTIMLNLYKWHKENPENCLEYCTKQRPEFEQLYKIVSIFADD